jgi:hypothetical protein
MFYAPFVKRLCERNDRKTLGEILVIVVKLNEACELTRISAKLFALPSPAFMDEFQDIETAR